MKKEKKEFLILRNKIKNYNKLFIIILFVFIVYALIHSVTIIDCNDKFSTLSSKGNYSCVNVSNDVFNFLFDNYMVISILLLVAASVVLFLQKVELWKINQLDVDLLAEEKVSKGKHVLLTLLFGYTGIHKFKTNNKVIGYIYLINFILFGISWIIKNFSIKSFNNYVIFRVTYEFGWLFLLGIIILNIIEVVASILSLKDDDGKIFA